VSRLISFRREWDGNAKVYEWEEFTKR